MNYFWGNIFDYVKDRRFVPVFFITLGVLFGVPLAVAVLVGTTNIKDYFQYWPVMLSVVVGGLVISIFRNVAQARAQRRHGYKVSPLSRDELSKARSKLLKR